MDQNLEWLESHKQISYPFINPVSDALKGRIVDALIIDGERVEERVRLIQFTVTTWTPAGITVGLQYVDSLTSFFSTTPTINVSSFGAYGVISMRSEVERKEVLITVVLDNIAGVDIIENAVFVTRIQEPGQESVRSVTFEAEEDGLPVEYTITGPFSLQAGYNMTLSAGVAEEIVGENRLETPVILSASPGAGLGKVPSDCESDGTLRTINGVSPNEFGDFTIDCDGCHRCYVGSSSHDATTIVQAPNTLVLANDCTPCCDCEDYERTYKAMDNIYVDGTVVGGVLEDAARNLGQTMAGMNRERNRRQIRKKMLTLRPTAGWFVGVTFSIINNPLVAMNLEAEPWVFTGTVNGTVLTTTNIGILTESCYVYNSGWKFGWQKFAIDEVFSHTTFSGDNTVDETVTLSLALPAPYDTGMVLEGTQYTSVFFELFVKDTAARAHENIIELTVEDAGTYATEPDPRVEDEKILQPFSEDTDVT